MSKLLTAARWSTDPVEAGAPMASPRAPAYRSIGAKRTTLVVARGPRRVPLRSAKPGPTA